MVTEAATFLIEGALPEKLAGTARGSDPLRFAEGLSRAREAGDSETVEGHHDLVVARRLRSPVPNCEQLGPQWSHLGNSAREARSILLRCTVIRPDAQNARTARLVRQGGH